MKDMERCGSGLDLPGFRFHPTEEELLEFYLQRAANGKKLNFDIIGTLNLYLHEPWDLPALAKIGEREWYFFVPRDPRPGNGGRPNRKTERGFWKATGSDRHIRSTANHRRLIGLRKTLVYYRGRATRCTKTDWVMNEYRLPNSSSVHSSMADIVLCKVLRKATSMRELEQRAAKEVSRAASQGGTVSATSCEQENSQRFPCDEMINMEIKEEFEDVPVEMLRDGADVSSTAAALPSAVPLLESTAVGMQPISSESLLIRGSSEVEKTPAQRQPPDLPALQVPYHRSFDWVVDPFVNQLRSPWLDQMWSPVFDNLSNF